MSATGRTGGAPVIFFYVQHLLGIGHVFRATRVARALAGQGARVVVAWGGTRLPAIDLGGLEMIWLPPVRSDSAHFNALVHPDGRPVSEAEKQERRDTLLAAFRRARPDILITEAFPFGRRQMLFELVPLVAEARDADWKPLIVASIRDMMQEGRAQNRVDESIGLFERYFDLLLVHGDPRMIRIEETLQGAEAILDRVRYTGLVTPEPPDLSIPASIVADVVISAGGGAVGHALTAAAIGANRHSRLSKASWLLVAGPERAEADYEDLRRRADPQMQVVRFVPDLARVFAAARVSVSRAGYNTVGDLMRARCRSVLVPFAGGRETEQLRRAQLLARLGQASCLTDDELDAERLGAAVDRALELPPLAAGWDLDGAAHGAAILLQAWSDRSGK